MKLYKKITLFICFFGTLVVGGYVGACMLGGSSFSETMLFLARFIAAPTQVGAVAPSSQVLAQSIIFHVEPGQSGEGKRFLEIGPGTGAITQELVLKLGVDDRLDVVELDAEMATMLAKKYAGNPAVTVLQLSITDWKPEYQYDAIVMGIPFNVLPYALVQEIWKHTRTLIKPQGVISYFSYLGLPDVKKFFLLAEEKEEFLLIQAFMSEQYREYGIAMKRIWANVPPAAVWFLQFTTVSEIV